MNQEMTKRRNKVLVMSAIVLVAGISYGAVTGWLGFGIPCPFHFITGLKCPGCGISRMFISLLRLDIKEAFYANRMLLAALPVIIYLLAAVIFRYIRTGSKKFTKFENILCIVLIVLFLLFALVRNLPGVNW